VPIKDIKVAFSATSHIWIILTTSAILILPKEMPQTSINSGALKGEGLWGPPPPRIGLRICFSALPFPVSNAYMIHFIMYIYDK